MRINKGDQFIGVINKIKDNGIFCSLQGSSEFGFVPNNLMSSFFDDDNNLRYGVKDKVTVYIYNINEKGQILLSDEIAYKIAYKKEQRRVRLRSFTTTYEVGTIFEAKIVDINNFIITIQVGDVDGIITKEEIDWNEINQISSLHYIGEIINAVYLKYKNDTLYFSIKRLIEKPYLYEQYDLLLSDLLKTIGMDSPMFIGQAKKYPYGLFMENLYSISKSKYGLLLVDPIYGYNLRALVPKTEQIIEIKEGNYYKFRIELIEKAKRLKRNQLFQFYAINIEYAENPYLQDVKIAFQRNTTNPSSNQRDAKLLEEIGKNMYSSKERMFYELIQNADDAAAINGVNIVVNTNLDYLIVKYNGYPFNKDDFEAITSAANGTKKANENKTGYKGIGFKSVFTDSQMVYIRTGGYQFRFDKNDIRFTDFNLFYLDNNPTLTNNEAKQAFLRLYDYNKKQFDGVHSIPWQLEPIWTEEFPTELGQNFYNANVAIALKLGASKIEGSTGYKAAIDDIIANPKFMLFLRNTTRIDFNGKTISKQKENNIVFLKNSFNNKPIEQFYIDDYNVNISNDIFKSIDLDIQILIKEKDEETGKIIEAVFVDKNNIDIDNIPSKIAITNSTTISFALPINEDGTLMPNKNSSDISIFAFLPTLVKEFRFPFYINANFILDPPRQRIIGDNPWNFYLMHETAKLLVKCCSEWSQKEDYNALNLLISQELETNNSDIKQLSYHFNRAYKSALESIPFILNHYNELTTQDNIIIDKTGLSEIIGADIFCSILQTTKTLPSSKIDTTILNKDIFEQIDKIDIQTVANQIKDSNILNQWYIKADTNRKEELHKWIIKNIEQCKDIIYRLPLFTYCQDNLSYNDINTNDTYIITTEHIKPIKEIIERIGFSCSDNCLEDITLNQYIVTTKESILFERIIAKLNETELTNAEKKNLFLSLKEFEDVGDVRLSKLALFCNLKGNPTQLSQMLPYRADAPAWIHPYMIASEENFEELSKYLVSPNDEFCKIIWEHLNDIPLSVTELYTIYKWTDQKYTQELIKKCTTNDDFAELLPIIHDATKPVKQQYLNTIKRLDLSSDKFYSIDSFEYQVLQLTLEVFDNPSDFSPKIYYDNTCITEYSIKDEVVCSYEENGIKKQVTLSLAQILPELQNQSQIINHIKELFEVKHGLDKFFVAKTQSLKEIYNDIDKLYSVYNGDFWPLEKTTNAYQYLFCVYYIKWVYKWESSYAKIVKLEKAPIEFVYDIMNFCFENEINLKQSPFTYRVREYISNKYFDNDYIIESEKLLPAIEKWAETTEKKQYLINNGVKTADDNIIKFRHLFIENSPIDFIDKLSDGECTSILQYLSTKVELLRPFQGENQKQALLELKNKKVYRFIDIYNKDELSTNSHELDTTEYKNWQNNDKPHIFIYPNLMPKQLKYNEILLIEYNDTKYYFDRPNLYLTGTIDLNILIFELAHQGKYRSGLEVPDYQTLCLDGKVLINKEEKDALEIENKRLNDEVQKLKDELSKYKHTDSKTNENEQNVEAMQPMVESKTSTISKGEVSTLSKDEQKEAQLEAQRFLMQKYPKWTFPNGFGYDENNYSTTTIYTENGEKINIVLKSYKDQGQPFKINIPEWDFIIDENAHIWIYTGSDIVRIDIKEMLRNQNTLSISFNTNNLDVEDKIQQFADAMRYFNELHLDFDCFRLSKKAIPIDQLYNTHEGRQIIYSDEESL